MESKIIEALNIIRIGNEMNSLGGLMIFIGGSLINSGNIIKVRGVDMEIEQTLNEKRNNKKIQDQESVSKQLALLCSQIEDIKIKITKFSALVDEYNKTKGEI